ncbi:MAG: hypothetical protein QOJ65_1659 [Fimbriimonadaceae bacterium]|nr:hypothetical protein [Fimbriimonadaceae bacterium]
MIGRMSAARRGRSLLLTRRQQIQHLAWKSTILLIDPNSGEAHVAFAQSYHFCIVRSIGPLMRGQDIPMAGGLTKIGIGMQKPPSWLTVRVILEEPC